MSTETACEGCNVCLHGECYACMVGVATGPESHDQCCAASNVRFSDDGLHVLDPNPTTHRIHTRENGEQARWECSCGSAGSASSWTVDEASDRHINYDVGEGRVETSRPF